MQLERTNTKYKIYCIVIVQVDHKNSKGLQNLDSRSDFPRVLYSRVLGSFMGFLGVPLTELGVPLTELGTRLIFLCVLRQNCASLTRIHA